MKKGFTLIEMLVVVAILATLMTMVFRLSGIGNESDRRNTTIVRLQRLENCLSGYYAAFGSYPPVKLHGSRSPYKTVDEYGIQEEGDNAGIFNWTRIGETAEKDAWRQVQAACRAQPVACNYPYPDGYEDLVSAVSEGNQALLGKDGYTENDLGSDTYRKFQTGFTAGRNASSFSNRDKSDWRNIQLFRFGLMSYLLPRYLIMMNGADAFFNGSFAQWSENNIPPSNPYEGEKFEGGWLGMRDLLQRGETDQKSMAQLANIPSQAVCARWMPNLAGICNCNHGYTLFGVDIKSSSPSALSVGNFEIEIYSNAGGEQYVLDGITVQDGWWNDFYYYSPPPYQTYTLWSAGANGRTFPPWISKANLGGKANQCVAKWTEDDIIHMSN